MPTPMINLNPSATAPITGVQDISSMLNMDATGLNKESKIPVAQYTNVGQATNVNLALGADEQLRGIRQNADAQLKEAQISDTLKLSQATTQMANAQYTSDVMGAFQSDTAPLQQVRDQRMGDYTTAVANKGKVDAATPNAWENPIGWFKGKVESAYLDARANHALEDVAESQHAMQANLQIANEKIQLHNSTNTTLNYAAGVLAATEAAQGLESQKDLAAASWKAGAVTQDTATKMFSASEQVSNLNLKGAEFAFEQGKQKMLLGSDTTKYVAWLSTGGKSIPTDKDSLYSAAQRYQTLPPSMQEEISKTAAVWNRQQQAGIFNQPNAVGGWVQQLAQNSTPDAVDYTAQLLGDNATSKVIQDSRFSLSQNMQTALFKQALAEARSTGSTKVDPASISDSEANDINNVTAVLGKDRVKEIAKQAQTAASRSAMGDSLLPYVQSQESSVQTSFGTDGKGFSRLAVNPNTIPSLAKMGVDKDLLALLSDDSGKALMASPPINSSNANGEKVVALYNGLIARGKSKAQAAQAVADFTQKAMIVGYSAQGNDSTVSGITNLGYNLTPSLMVTLPTSSLLNGPFGKPASLDMTKPGDIQNMAARIESANHKITTQESFSVPIGLSGGL